MKQVAVVIPISLQQGFPSFVYYRNLLVEGLVGKAYDQAYDSLNKLERMMKFILNELAKLDKAFSNK